MSMTTIAFPGMSYMPYLAVAFVIALGIGCYNSGFKRTIGSILPGLLLIAAGFGLTALTEGNTIFIGAMALGAILVAIGLFMSIASRNSN